MGAKNNGKRYITDFAEIPMATTPVAEVEVPEWADAKTGGVPVLQIRLLSSSERKRFLVKGELHVLGLTDDERKEAIGEWQRFFDSGERDRELVRLSYVRPDGRLLFTESQVAEIFERPDPRPWIRLVAAAEEANLIDAKSADDFRKNVQARPSAGPSDSPAPSTSPTQG